jgi:hypothetical protein
MMPKCEVETTPVRNQYCLVAAGSHRVVFCFLWHAILNAVKDGKPVYRKDLAFLDIVVEERGFVRLV